MPQTVRSSWLSRTLAIAVASNGWSWTTSTRIGVIEDLLTRRCAADSPGSLKHPGRYDLPLYECRVAVGLARNGTSPCAAGEVIRKQDDHMAIWLRMPLNRTSLSVAASALASVAIASGCA